MPRRKFVALGVASAIFVTLIFFANCTERTPNTKVGPPSPSGTSVVVLIDFSKSFAVSTIQNGNKVYGLQPDDRRALTAVAGTIADLASRSWTPPLKSVWTEIQTSSITDDPLCPPLETVQKLVKPVGSVGTREEIQQVLTKCVDDVMKASKQERHLAAYTDISGAVAAASDVASGEIGERVLLILSDFHEDLRPGSKRADFALKGERVVLIHRPGTDEPENITGYLARIDHWKETLLKNGAGSVVSVPAFGVSESRLRAALRPQEYQLGTDLTVLADFKDELLPALGSGPGQRALLVQIGKTLADAARDWPAPVTTLWMSIGSTGFGSKTMPPVEFGPSLIKKEHALNTVEEFSRTIEELALALPNKRKEAKASDISGSVALACSLQPSAPRHFLIVISDFIDDGPQPPTNFQLGGTHVIMICKPSSLDQSDPNKYFARRRDWEQRFKQSGAATVDQISLMSFTSNDLRLALDEPKSTGTK